MPAGGPTPRTGSARCASRRGGAGPPPPGGLGPGAPPPPPAALGASPRAGPGPRPRPPAAALAAAFIAAPLPWLLGSMSAWLLLSWGALPLAAQLARTLDTRTDGPALNAALARTGVLQLAFCVLFAAGILASGGIGS